MGELVVVPPPPTAASPLELVVIDPESGGVVGYLTNYLEGTRFLNEHNGPGQGEIVLPITANPEIGFMQHGKVVQFNILTKTTATLTPAFRMMIEDWRKDVVQEDEERAEIAVFSGRSNLAYLSEAVVFPWSDTPATPVGAFGSGGPQPYSDNRIFNFASPDYDDSGWTPPHNLGQQDNPTVPDFNPFGLPTNAPDGWPENAENAYWLAPFVANDRDAPPGVVYYRAGLIFPRDTIVDIYAAADDEFLFYIDGIPLLAEVVAARARLAERVQIREGTHIIGIRTEQYVADGVRGTPGANPTATLFAVMDKAADNMDEPLWLSHPSTSVHLAYPAEVPGWTAGRIVDRLLNEAKTRGCLMGLTWDFSETHGSNGVPWENIPEFTVAIGQTYLDVVTRLANAGKVDVWMEPSSMMLHMAPFGTRGQTRAVNLYGHPASPSEALTNVTELVWETTSTEIGVSPDGQITGTQAE